MDKLFDPKYFNDELAIEGFGSQELTKFLDAMILIRKAEEKLAENIENGVIKCPCHLGVGQEAIAVGVSSVLRNSDKVFGAHRSHSHFLALNSDLDGLFSEVLGKESGSSKGMGGSMHLIDRSVGFEGSVPIVSATIPIATGAALAAKLNKKGEVAVAYFGDGATEEGAFHESLNLASTHKLPVLYICENNLFSSHLHISLRQPSQRIARFAESHLIESATLDGNNVTEISKHCQKAVDKIRNTNRPYFLELITYRWKGHVGYREDMDVGVKRKEDLLVWRNRDPIRRLELALINSKTLTQDSINDIHASIDFRIKESWKRAIDGVFPEKNNLLDLVYSKK